MFFGASNAGRPADVRYRGLDAGDVASSNRVGEPVGKSGLVAALGAKPASAAETAKDSDGDGVPDDADLCPGTAQGVKVDAKGCPLDSDGDGVPDGIDQCPGTPPGVAVDAKGCPTTLGSGRFQIMGTGADQIGRAPGRERGWK